MQAATLSSMERIGDIINGKMLAAATTGDPVTPAGDFAGRQGFDRSFLKGWEIRLPMAIGTKEKDMLKLKDSEEVELKYLHFSVIMSASRKMPMLTAVNIDGKQLKSIGRADTWFLDGRLNKEDQLGNEIYANNRLDKGHMVRREDPVWGDDAKTANLDTFHYTNCCPQMDVFNQQTWLGLEDYILKHAKVDGMQASVFTGPFFTHNDLEYKGVSIPGAFWKVVAIVKEDGSPSATAYKISQEKELGELQAAFVYGPYLTYQISIQQVMDDTGIDFSGLVKFDGYSQHELETGVRMKNPIRELNDIKI